MPRKISSPLRRFPETLRHLADAAFGGVREPTLSAPSLLYHYTGAEGLHGITSSKSIRATNLLFLNDARERSYAVEMMRGIVKGIHADLNSIGYGGLGESTYSSFYGAVDWALGNLEDQDVYVASFSRSGDLLSQWRAYCPADGGYSLGFDARRIADLASARGFAFGPCFYKRADQDRILRAALDAVATEVVQWLRTTGEPSYEDISGFARGFVKYFLVFAAFLKDPTFAEEDEWRVVSTDLQPNDPLITVRASRGLLIPHYNFPLEDVEGPASIERLLIGPMPNPHLAKRALSRYAASSSLPIKVVEMSEIPYRVVR